MPKSPLSPALPGLLAAEVVTKSTTANKTYYVRLRFLAEQPPTALIESLAAIAFVPPRPHHDTSYAGHTVVLDLVKPGSALFQAWTVAEAESALAALRDVFAKHGLPFNPRRADATDLL